jgi:patatin-like phospholipase/acyl hydrolase
MQKFLRDWGVSQSDFWKYPDALAGVSIGSILACGYALSKIANEMESFFLEKAKRIFTIRTAVEKLNASHNAGTDSNRPNTLQK